MKQLRFTNGDGTLDITYLVDLIGTNDACTVYQVIQKVWEEDKQSTIVKSEFYIREKQVDFANEITKSENRLFLMNL